MFIYFDVLAVDYNDESSLFTKIQEEATDLKIIFHKSASSYSIYILI